ncbi:hypothetical protein PLESTF_001984000 [Pleodorina starrii]|nr:hypothetical protein PLESTF_001937500 [Pleodorina starrii]GLC77737.1 hypothetical protein PLESTF_001984000 [Pleodorina starrii]
MPLATDFAAVVEVEGQRRLLGAMAAAVEDHVLVRRRLRARAAARRRHAAAAGQQELPVAVGGALEPQAGVRVSAEPLACAQSRWRKCPSGTVLSIESLQYMFLLSWAFGLH